MNCVICDAEIHPLRLKVLPNTKVCVECSNVGRKTGKMTTFGKGDNTYQELTFTDSVEEDRRNTFRDDELRDYDAKS